MRKLDIIIHTILVVVLFAISSTAAAQESKAGHPEKIINSFSHFDKASREIVEAAAKSGNTDALFVWGYRQFWDDLDGKKDDADLSFDNVDNSVLFKRAEIAKPWFEKAAALGHAESMNWLATIAENFADEPNMALAIQYLEKSARAGSSAAKANYGMRMIEDEQKSALALKYLLEAETEAEWTEDSQEFNMTLFRVYTFKLAGQKYNPVKAVSYGKKCAYGEYALPGCQFLLARYYQNGWGVPANAKEAAKLFSGAAKGNIPAAQWYLGMAYLDGSGVEKNERMAYKWVERAAENDYLNGMISFAVMNALGEGTKVNPKLAFEWYEKAAHMGSHHALRGAGMMLYVGEGRKVDKETGLAMLIIASEKDELAETLLRQYIDEYDSKKAKISRKYTEKIANIRKKYGF